jgi:hypothetical protein
MLAPYDFATSAHRIKTHPIPKKLLCCMSIDIRQKRGAVHRMRKSLLPSNISDNWMHFAWRSASLGGVLPCNGVSPNPLFPRTL